MDKRRGLRFPNTELKKSSGRILVESVRRLTRTILRIHLNRNRVIVHHRLAEHSCRSHSCRHRPWQHCRSYTHSMPCNLQFQIHRKRHRRPYPSSSCRRSRSPLQVRCRRNRAPSAMLTAANAALVQHVAVAVAGTISCPHRRIRHSSTSVAVQAPSDAVHHRTRRTRRVQHNCRRRRRISVVVTSRESAVRNSNSSQILVAVCIIDARAVAVVASHVQEPSSSVAYVVVAVSSVQPGTVFTAAVVVFRIVVVVRPPARIEKSHRQRSSHPYRKIIRIINGAEPTPFSKI